MTTRELRATLFHLTDQNMTVKELRAMLFGVQDQDDGLELSSTMWIELEQEYVQAKEMAQ
jgi:hypothetical protein